MGGPEFTAPNAPPPAVSSAKKLSKFALGFKKGKEVKNPSLVNTTAKGLLRRVAANKRSLLGGTDD